MNAFFCSDAISPGRKRFTGNVPKCPCTIRVYVGSYLNVVHTGHHPVYIRPWQWPALKAYQNRSTTRPAMSWPNPQITSRMSTESTAAPSRLVLLSQGTASSWMQTHPKPCACAKFSFALSFACTHIYIALCGLVV